VEVRFDEFTEDIEENRLLRAALHKLSFMRISNDDHRRALGVFAAALNDVSPIEYDRRRLLEVPISRLNARYGDALQIARLILRPAAIEVEAGPLSSYAFTVDMNDVFEDFVVRALRDALRLSAQAFPQNALGRRMRFDERENIRLKPDFSWWEAGECRLVGDVKYKCQ